jgi:hypothetical protein
MAVTEFYALDYRCLIVIRPLHALTLVLLVSFVGAGVSAAVPPDRAIDTRADGTRIQNESVTLTGENVVGVDVPDRSRGTGPVTSYARIIANESTADSLDTYGLSVDHPQASEFITGTDFESQYLVVFVHNEGLSSEPTSVETVTRSGGRTTIFFSNPFVEANIPGRDAPEFVTMSEDVGIVETVAIRVPAEGESIPESVRVRFGTLRMNATPSGNRVPCGWGAGVVSDNESVGDRCLPYVNRVAEPDTRFSTTSTATATPTPATTATDTPAATASPTPTPTPVPTDSTPPATTPTETDGTTPGFGVASSLISLATLAVLSINRSGD